MNQPREGRRRLLGVSLHARDTDEALAGLERAAREADVAELRLDLMEEYDLNRLLDNPPCPVVVTNRPERHGGRYTGSERERLATLYAAVALGAPYIDVEDDAAAEVPARGDSQLLVSFHNFQNTPDNLETIRKRLLDAGADVPKLAVMAHTLWDNLQVLRLFNDARQPLIAIAMGEVGTATRVLALRYRSAFLTYASLDEEAVAPGQIPVGVMKDAYLIRSIRSETLPFGLLGPRAARDGDHLRRLNHGLRQAGIDGVCVPLPTDHLEAALLRAYVTQAHFRGFFIADELAGQAPGVVEQTVSAHAGVVNVIHASPDARLTGIHADNPVVRLAERILAG